MSTTYQILPNEGDWAFLPDSLTISESGMKYDISMWYTAWNEGEGLKEFEGLSAQEVIAAATKMIQVVLYQHPELKAEVLTQIGGL